MSRENDEDIKIYEKKSSSDTSEFDRLIEKIDFNRLNGNKEKAEKLGALFAVLRPDDEALGITDNSRKLTSPVLYQARVFITFLCGRVTREKINDQFLSDTVRNAMYNYLKENEAGYYKNITDGAAFSFYRVALKKAGVPEEIVGKEFAKLCGSSKSEELTELGKTVYLKTVSYAELLIEKCDFKY